MIFKDIRLGLEFLSVPVALWKVFLSACHMSISSFIIKVLLYWQKTNKHTKHKEAHNTTVGIDTCVETNKFRNKIWSWYLFITKYFTSKNENQWLRKLSYWMKYFTLRVSKSNTFHFLIHYANDFSDEWILIKR